MLSDCLPCPLRDRRGLPEGAARRASAAGIAVQKNDPPRQYR